MTGVACDHRLFVCDGKADAAGDPVPDIESFNGRTRDEVLDVELFHTLAEAKVILADWLIAYNTEHPHSALGMMPPARFAERWWEENGAPTPGSTRPTGSLREASVDPATVAADTDQELSLRVDR